LEEREEVARAKSPRSINATFSPRIAASRAIAAPLIPPPMIARSKLSRARRAICSSRFRGDVRGSLIVSPQSHGVVTY
jgi:hypothetical protein